MDCAAETTDQSDDYEWFLSRCFHDEYKTIPIRTQCLTLGRGDDVGFQFCPKTYNYLSRKHCMVQILDGKPTITDCNSGRGTFVNGERLDKFCPGRVELKEGDLVGIGHKINEIQQYFKFHTTILKYRVCRKIRDDEAIIISDEETDASETPPMSAMVMDTPSAESLGNMTTTSSESNEINVPKVTSPVPGPSGMVKSGCVSIPIEFLRNSSFEEEYDMCATRLNEVCYESDTEPSCSSRFVPNEIITLSDDDDDEYADLHHTQMILEEVKKELADIENQTALDNICEETNVQWSLKLKSNKDVDATQRYKQKANEGRGKNDSSKKGKVESTSSSSKKAKGENKEKKSTDKKHHQKSAEHSAGKERKNSCNETKAKPTYDGPLKISLKRSLNDWVIANETAHDETKKARKSIDTLDEGDGQAADDGRKQAGDEMAKAISKTVVQEQPKCVRRRRHSVADWTELGARKPNGTIEITPPEHFQSIKAALTHHRPPSWMTSFSTDPKPSTADPKTATAESSHGAAGDSTQKHHKPPTLKRRGSIASPEEMNALLQKKFKPRANAAVKIFEFHPLTAASKEQKEQRKNRLIEVTMNKKHQEKTTSAKDEPPAACKKTVPTKPKVKFTPNNRGMFLTAPIPPPPSRVASTSRPTPTDESIVCTQSTTLDQLPNAGVAEVEIDTRPKKLTFESVARLSNVNRPAVPSGGELRKITARRFSVMEPPTFLNRPQSDRPAGSSISTNGTIAISSHSTTVTTISTANSSKHSNVTHSTRVVSQHGSLVRRFPLKGILKPYNATTVDVGVQKKSVTIMENLNKIKLIEKYIIASSNTVREHMANHEQELIADILRWSPQWLMQQQSECSSHSPFGSEDKMLPKQKEYEDYETFKRIHSPFFKRELWNELFSTYKIMPFSLLARTVVIRPTRRSDLCEIECEVPINGADQQRAAGYDFGIMEFYISQQQKCYSFFYIHTHKPTRMLENGHGQSGTHSTQGMKYLLYVPGQQLNILKMGRNFVLRPFTRIYLCLRRGNAICALKFSQLLCNILTPAFNVANVLEVAKRPSSNISAQLHTEAGSLNSCQMKVLSAVLVECFCKELPTISIIQGPPGTGKSRVITQLILKLIRIARSIGLKMKVLVCASSNTAVDVIVKNLITHKSRLAQTSNSFKLVRTGSKNKVEPSCMQVYVDKLIQDRLRLENGNVSNRNSNSAEFIRPIRTKEEITARSQILNEADVVCTTLGSCPMLASYSIDIEFNVCIIDEATQCTELCTLLPLQYNISKLVLVGDVHQLPATVLDQQSVESGFRKSLFSRLYQSYVDNQYEKELKVLTTQYRMHPEISHWPNKYFYKRQLKNASCTEVQRKEIPLKPYMVISLSYDQELTQAQYEIYNKDEIRFVVGLLKQMVSCCDKQASFAIITPYARHKEELVHTLRNLKLDRVAAHSIDSVQGKEFDVVIISLARSNGAGFLDQPERINVALTRAKQCLVLCGNFTSLKNKPVWSSLLEDAQKRKVYYKLEDHDAHSYGEQMVKHIMQRLRKS